MENGAFAPKEQMLHFPYFQIHDISKASKRVLLWSKGLKCSLLFMPAASILEYIMAWGQSDLGPYCL